MSLNEEAESLSPANQLMSGTKHQAFGCIKQLVLVINIELDGLKSASR